MPWPPVARSWCRAGQRPCVIERHGPGGAVVRCRSDSAHGSPGTETWRTTERYRPATKSASSEPGRRQSLQSISGEKISVMAALGRRAGIDRASGRADGECGSERARDYDAVGFLRHDFGKSELICPSDEDHPTSFAEPQGMRRSVQARGISACKWDDGRG